jgi:hypothetical protein
MHAMQALSQLSYGPTWRRRTLPEGALFVKKTRAPGRRPDQPRTLAASEASSFANSVVFAP